LLNIISGRAGTGKTNYIMNEIKRRMGAGETGMLLIVPEQYSHYAERQLCAICGDRLSLHAEVSSFTRLCSNVLAETGNANRPLLTKSGQILAMYRALESIAPGLKVYGIKRMRTEVLERLLEAVAEFKTLNITPITLEEAAKLTSNPLSDKLQDLALIYDAYDALLQTHGDDAADRLTLLADCIGESTVGSTGHIYFDGFCDFTAQELNIIEELLRKKANLTVCLTSDPNDTGEIFKIPQRTITQLTRFANKTGNKTGDRPRKTGDRPLSYDPDNKTGVCPLSYAPVLVFLEKNLFKDSPPQFPGHSDAISNNNDAIKLYKAPSRYTECEYAASEILKLVRNGYRWRDIVVMARDWDEYGSICENVFDKYGIPYFTGIKTDVLSKPPLTLIDAALEAATYGWEYKSIFRYLKSGLLDISTDQCAVIENYVLKWQIRGALWAKEWIMPPRGYGRAGDDDEEQLDKINALRRKVHKPLFNLRNGIKGESTAETKLRALYSFLEEIQLPQRIITKANKLASSGELRLSDEYLQLWDIIVDAIDQMCSILGSEKLSAVEFHKLIILALSQNDVGVIPVSLDRTPLGSMAMSRRRDLKCLILLGATDDNLPSLNKSAGALSDNERMMLQKLGTDIPAGMEERLYREMNLLYSTLTLPSEKLVLIYSTGENQRPSFINRRLSDMFSVPVETIAEDYYMSSAKTPYLELLQLQGLSLNHIKNEDGSFTFSIIDDSSPGFFARQSEELSKQSAQMLYGKNFSLSATRIDNYYSCPYKYFLKNGLGLETRLPADFNAQEAGIFIHYILDNVFNDIKSGVGFKNIDASICCEMTEGYIKKYTKDILLDFEGKDARFAYLFDRYRTDAVRVVLDMVNELANSSFEPLDLELDMSKLSNTERGFIDRVDGYEHEGRLYLRVIDYKTRKKAYSFELGDVLNGRDMQMLIYLFALKNHGIKRYGKEIEPVGILYVPAREIVLSTTKNATEEDILKKRTAEMRRSGLILNDPLIIEAMENGPNKNYLPVKTTKDGDFSGDSLVTANQIGLLSNHVNKMIKNALENISNGVTECRPYYKSDRDNACNFCDYHTVCGFDEEIGDKRSYFGKKSEEEIWMELEASI